MLTTMAAAMTARPKPIETRREVSQLPTGEGEPVIHGTTSIDRNQSAKAMMKTMKGKR